MKLDEKWRRESERIKINQMQVKSKVSNSSSSASSEERKKIGVMCLPLEIGTSELVKAKLCTLCAIQKVHHGSIKSVISSR